MEMMGGYWSLAVDVEAGVLTVGDTGAAFDGVIVLITHRVPPQGLYPTHALTMRRIANGALT